MTQNILFSVADSIATISFNRPKVMNALDWDMIVRFREVCEEVRDIETVRAVLIRGEGPAFLAGGNVVMFHTNLKQLQELVVNGAHELHNAILTLRHMNKPVVASVHGRVAGGGIGVMLSADLVIAAEDTQFTMVYSRIAASPDGGSTYFLPRIVGYHKAMELALLSDTIDAQTAKSFGIVNFVVPTAELQDQTAKLMQRLAQGPTHAYGETKALMNQSPNSSLEQQLQAEVEAFSRCTSTTDIVEGITAFVEKRKPTFTGK